MKFFTLSLMTAIAVASPIVQISEDGLEALHARQLGQPSQANATNTRNELKDGAAGACPKTIFIFARASTEGGNMGGSTGPAVAKVLEDTYGADNVWVQGIGGPYEADLASNFLPGGTSQAAITEAIDMFKQANEKCPDTPVVAGGYSQGTAVISNSIPKLDDATRKQVKGIVLFGYTQNAQNRRGVPSYPAEDLKVFCAVGDLVCTGTLTITAAHFSYAKDSMGPAPQFLMSKIDAGAQ